MGQKDLADVYIIGIVFGLLGAHHFYLKRTKCGIVYLCTFGLFGIGYVFDLFRMKWLVEQANLPDKDKNDEKLVSDGFLLTLFGGILGAHHFYFGNKKLGILYAFTLGVFTIGWIVDLFRIHQLVHRHNTGDTSTSLITAYILGVSPLGIFGSYHYYLGNIKLGITYTLTFGIFGIGWMVDLVRMPTLLRKAGLEQKSVITAYIMAVPPFGLLGAHHMYLEHYKLGALYTFTLGIFGIGWVVDLIRMTTLVKLSNNPCDKCQHKIDKVTAYVICASPLGIFGAHHLYLKRYMNFAIFLPTLGLFGLGCIFDILRLPALYERYEKGSQHKYLDDAYMYWLPFGIFGLHNFYLERKRWGLFYLITGGVALVGWIVDGFRLPYKVQEWNDGHVVGEAYVPLRICNPKKIALKLPDCKHKLYVKEVA